MASPPGSPAVTLPALTGLRGLAALWVVVFHVQAFFPASMAAPSPARAFIGHGWVAVDLFFVLSGFVLMHAHGRAFRAVETDAVARFLVQRALRVYPTATVVLLLILGLIVADPGFAADRQSFAADDLTLRTFLLTLALATRWTLTPVQDWNLPVWSLSAEVLGYLAFPWIAQAAGAVTSAKAALARGLGCILLLTLVNALTGRSDFNDYGTFAIARMAGGFVGGVYLARAFALAPRLPRLRADVLALGAAATLCTACAVPTLMPLALVSSALLVLALAYDGPGVARALSAPPVLWLGRISFPLYLVHMEPIKWLAYRARIAPPGVPALDALLAACVVGSLAVAALLHILVERPTHRLARRLGVKTDGARRRELAPGATTSLVAGPIALARE